MALRQSLQDTPGSTARVYAGRDRGLVDVLRHLHDHPATTRADLARDLGLSRGSATEIAGRLRALSLIDETEPVPTGTRGRPTKVMTPHPYGPVVCAIDISHEEWRLATATLGGELTLQRQERHIHRTNSAEVLAQIAEALRDLHTTLGPRLRAVGVSIAGTVSNDRLVDASNLDWHNVDIAAALQLTPSPPPTPTLIPPKAPPAPKAPPEAALTPQKDSPAPPDDSRTPPKDLPTTQVAIPAPPTESLTTPETAPAPRKDSRTSPDDSSAQPDDSPAHPKDSPARPEGSPTRPESSLARSEGVLARSGDSFAGPEAGLGRGDVGLGGWGGAGGVAGAGVLVVVGNDATLAGVAEARRGAAREAVAALHLAIEVGVGGILMDHGRPVAGRSGAAGEFGHLPFGDPARPCGCGAYGCWDPEIDGRAMARHLNEPTPDDPRTAAEGVLARAAAGDQAAQAAVAHVARDFGRGVAGLVNALDPDVITLSGLAVEILEHAEPALRAAYQQGLMRFRRDAPPPLLPARFPADGSLRGAAELAFDQVLSEPGLQAWRALHEQIHT